MAKNGQNARAQPRHWRSHRLRHALGRWLFLVALVAVGRPSIAAETVTYYYTNEQGTPLATSDAAGNLSASLDYRPYEMQALGAPPQGPGYTGHVNDADTGLVYMQARYYDPEIGRFTSTDPAAPSAGNIFNVGRYVYGANNPIGNTDPDGRCVDGITCDSMAQSFAQHPEDALDGVAQDARSAFHGCCGEINAMSKAANAGAKLRGATVATFRAVGRQAGTLMKACPTCAAVAKELGVNVVSPP